MISYDYNIIIGIIFINIEQNRGLLQNISEYRHL